MQIRLFDAITRCAALGALVAPSVAQEPLDAAGIEFFEKKVRPVLVDRCYRCHGSKRQKSGLRLDSRQGILRGGERGPAVVPGDADHSRLIRALRYEDDDLQMPPKSKLDAATIANLTRWVQMGAPAPHEVPADSEGSNPRAPFDLQRRKAAHWAFRSAADVAPPAITDTTWPSDTLDRFILARLERAGLTPAASADRRTWIRRVYFDLIGLPPEPSAVAAFVADRSEGAFEHVVDKLLASPHFGERWARHWLDLVRYAESRGHEYDYTLPNPWHYRDYLIRAFNADVPYDRFLTEHVAGDLIPEPRIHPQEGWCESVLGTGFWFLGEEVHSPVDTRADEAERIDNKVDVFSKTFLGLTVGCARCHDHKFDAISAKDYYALSGYLLSSSYRQVRFESMLQNRGVAARLRDLREEHAPKIAAAVAAALEPRLDDAADYLLAAHDVLQAGPATSGEPAQLELDYLFEDFEDATYREWTVSGTAFGAGPVHRDDVPDYQGELGGRGSRVANSHASAGGKNSRSRDKHHGRLASPTFVIDRDHIHMLVGGGRHRDETCVNLVVDGEVVRTLSGRNSNRMAHATVDVSPWRGSKARLEIVDRVEGRWGYIGADQIVLANGAGEDALDCTHGRTEARLWGCRIESIATDRGLDSARLVRWIDTLRHAASDASHPLHLWAQLAQRDGEVAAAVDAIRAGLGERDAAARRVDSHGQVVADYAHLDAGEWFQDGSAFGDGPVPAGVVRFGTQPATPIVGLTTRTGAWQDHAWDDLELTPGTQHEPSVIEWVQSGRMLRTATVRLEGDNLYYLVRGSGHALVVIDSHRMIKGPLHKEAIRSWRGEGWQWVEHRLADYHGHRVYVEFSPADRDAGNPLAIARIVQASTPPETVDGAASLWLAELLDDASEESLARLARRTQTLLQDAVRRLGDRRGTSAADRVALADWALRELGLWAPPDDAREAAVVAAAEPFFAERDVLLALRRNQSRTAPALLEGSGVDEHVLVRGDSRSPDELVPRRLLEALGGTEAPAVTAGSGRLGLARQLTAPDNPLVSRVLVNRVWHHLFGRGIVATVDNFGVMGAPPSHPELLDHLSVEFVDDGWSIKRLIRRLVLSSTYRMSSERNPEAEQLDPDNRLWHRASVRRLEGEIIRDAMLAVAGRLDRTMFGRSVPIHLTPFLDGRGKPESGPLDGHGRRSIYLAVRRNFLESMFLVFDYPIPFTARGRRDVTNVPAQALTLMNSPFVVQQADRWAQRALIDEGSSDRQRITNLYLEAFARPPDVRELGAALAFIDHQRSDYGGAADTEVWADLCHVLFNVVEFIYLN